MATKTTPASPEYPQLALDALLARRQQIENRRRALRDEIIELEQSGAKYTDPGTSSRAAALKLLNGEAAPFITDPGAGKRTLLAARRELADCDLAIELSQPIEMRLRTEATAARIEAHAGPYAAAMRTVVLAVIELERAWQGHDRIVKAIRPGLNVLPGQTWCATLGGRLMPGGSGARRFLEYAVERGWITREEFNIEMARATDNAAATR